MGWGGQAGGTQGTHVVDELLDAVAQFVFVVPVERVVDGREGRVDAVCGGAAHVVDEVGQVFGGLQLDAPVRGGVHGGWLCLGCLVAGFRGWPSLVTCVRYCRRCGRGMLLAIDITTVYSVNSPLLWSRRAPRKGALSITLITGVPPIFPASKSGRSLAWWGARLRLCGAPRSSPTVGGRMHLHDADDACDAGDAGDEVSPRCSSLMMVAHAQHGVTAEGQVKRQGKEERRVGVGESTANSRFRGGLSIRVCRASP